MDASWLLKFRNQSPTAVPNTELRRVQRMHGVEYLNSEIPVNEEVEEEWQSKCLRQKLSETFQTFWGKIQLQAVFLYLQCSIH